jgi:hypothetical protein
MTRTATNGSRDPATIPEWERRTGIGQRKIRAAVAAGIGEEVHATTFERHARSIRMSDRPAIDLRTRLALRLNEAAAALGVSERTFRALRPYIPTLRIGDTVLVPVDAVRDWLSKSAVVESNKLDETAEELVSGLR